ALLGREPQAFVDDRIEEGDVALRSDSAKRIAAVLARSTGEKSSEENQLHVASVGSDLVVERKQKPDGRASGERELVADRDVAARLGLNADVTRLAAETGDLQIVGEPRAFSWMHRRVSQIDRRLRFDVGDHHRVKRWVERARIGERVFDLNGVRQRDVELPP